MKVWMDRDKCDSHLAACENCFGQFLRTLVPDRGCMLAWTDDGTNDVTVYMHSEGENHMVVIPDEMREIISYDGWPQFVDFHPAFRKHEHDEHLMH